jgi:hypothetical protein
LSVILAVQAFLLLPATAPLRSHLALAVQSRFFRVPDPLRQAGIRLEFPVGGLWTGSMKRFLMSGDYAFAGASGQMDIAILYNFGRFSRGRSSFYDSHSPCYNAHYGAYAVRLKDNGASGAPFGWTLDGQPDLRALAALTGYDQTALVMGSLGCPPEKYSFLFRMTDLHSGCRIGEFSDWVSVDGEIRTNAPLHRKTGELPGYLQYGSPPDYRGEDFLLMDLRGRLYMRYDPRTDLTVILFAIAQERETVEELSENNLWQVRWLPAESGG